MTKPDRMVFISGIPLPDAWGTIKVHQKAIYINSDNGELRTKYITLRGVPPPAAVSFVALESGSKDGLKPLSFRVTKRVEAVNLRVKMEEVTASASYREIISGSQSNQHIHTPTAMTVYEAYSMTQFSSPTCVPSGPTRGPRTSDQVLHRLQGISSGNPRVT